MASCRYDMILPFPFFLFSFCSQLASSWRLSQKIVLGISSLLMMLDLLNLPYGGRPIWVRTTGSLIPI